MKKIISLLVLIIMSFTLLVSCSDEITAEDLDRYKNNYKPEVREALELDFYIIVEEGTHSNAITTVQRYVNEYLRDKFNTTLDIHYLTAADYAATVAQDVVKTGSDRADIVLIAGEEMFNQLYAIHALANLTDFYNGNKYGKLNAEITSTLLEASLVTEQRTDIDGNNYDVSYYYTVPNDHVVGEYKYVLISKEIATNQLNYAPGVVAGMNTEDSVANLKADIQNKLNLNADEYVKVNVTGKYEDKAKYEAAGYYCNIAEYPTVTKAEAFLSSFAVVRAEDDTSYQNTADIPADQVVPTTPGYLSHYDRCMEVIYALNTDTYFRNLLLYGVEVTNYMVDDSGDIVPETEGPGVYRMNILYTGNVFKADYCSKYEWTVDAEKYGAVQNKESVLSKN